MSTSLWNAIVKSTFAFRSASRRFRRDERGVSAIEFVLIFPLLVTMLAGTVDIGQALTVSRKMNQVVSTLGDMAAQQNTWSTTDIDAIIAGTATIIEPFSETDLKIDLVAGRHRQLGTRLQQDRAHQGYSFAGDDTDQYRPVGRAVGRRESDVFTDDALLEPAQADHRRDHLQLREDLHHAAAQRQRDHAWLSLMAVLRIVPNLRARDPTATASGDFCEAQSRNRAGR